MSSGFSFEFKLEEATEKYELVKDIGSGNFGIARLMRNKETKELVAMKYIERGTFALLYVYFGGSPLLQFSFLISTVYELI